VSDTSAHQDQLTQHRTRGDDLETFMLDSGGFLTLKESDFVGADWHAGDDEGQFSAQPRLNIAFTDSVLHIAVAWRRDAGRDKRQVDPSRPSRA
jgi:hypothetical protein